MPPRLPFLAALVAAVAVAGCGGDDNEGTPGGGTPARSDASGNVTERLFAGSATANLRTPDEGKPGGTLTVLSGGDVDFLDPGKTYYTYTIGILNALHRGLYAYLPNDTTKPVPDLAAADPEIAPDGKTVTVKLRKGVMFSDPVDREVTSADVKYAIERAFTAASAHRTSRATTGRSAGSRRPTTRPSSSSSRGAPARRSPARWRCRSRSRCRRSSRSGSTRRCRPPTARSTPSTPAPTRSRPTRRARSPASRRSSTSASCATRNMPASRTSAPRSSTRSSSSRATRRRGPPRAGS